MAIKTKKTKKETAPAAEELNQELPADAEPATTSEIPAQQGEANAAIVAVKMDDGEVFEMPPMSLKEANAVVQSLSRESGKVTLNTQTGVEIFNVKNVARASARPVRVQEQEA